MAVDLTKLLLHTGYNAFKNNAIYTGSFNISGTAGNGTTTKTTTVALTQQPDLLDILFNGAADTFFSVDLRPADGWFKRGSVWVRGDNAGDGFVNYGTPWVITSSLSGLTLTISATYVQTFFSSLTLTTTPVYYRIVDYSVF